MRFSALKRTLFILSLAALIVAFAFTPVRAAINEIIWKKDFASSETTHTVTVDRNGNVIVAGETEDGPAFVRKLSGGGKELWSRKFQMLDKKTYIYDIEVDRDGFIYMSGVYGEVDEYDNLEPQGSFIAKYGPKGGHHWTRRLNARTVVYGLAVGPGGNLYATGPYTNALDSFVKKYTPRGRLIWSKAVQAHLLSDVAVGPGGGVYVVGIDWAAYYPVDYNPDNPQLRMLVLKKLSPRGGIYWTRRITRQTLQTYSYRLAVDRAGGVIVASTNSDDAFITKYTHKGKRLWTRLWGRKNVKDVTVDRDRNIYVVGMADEWSPVAFARQYGPGGAMKWTRYFAYGLGTGAAADTEGNLFVAGGLDAFEWGVEELGDSSFLVKFPH